MGRLVPRDKTPYPYPMDNELTSISTVTCSGMFDISGRAAIITGAAGGIGREISTGMAALGVKVAAVDRDETMLGDLVSSSAKRGLTMTGIRADVTDERSLGAMADQVVDTYGGIDILVNCAGVNHFADSATCPEDMWDRVIDINLKGTFLACKSVARHMLEARRGRIVNFSSVRGLQGKERYTAYAASKGGVNLLTRSLAIEWAPNDVNVNAVAPAFTRTEMTQTFLSDKKAYDWVVGRIPKGTLCEPEWLLGPIVFLCAPCSEFVTGHILYVDGGWTAS